MYTCLIADDHIAERDLIKVFYSKNSGIAIGNSMQHRTGNTREVSDIKMLFQNKGKKVFPDSGYK